MTHAQILEAIRLMPTIERLEIVEFTLELMSADVTKDSEVQPAKQLSLVAVAELMRDFYAEGRNLAEFRDRSTDDFSEYENYA